MSDFEIIIKDNSKQFLKKLEEKIPVALEACGLQAEKYAKQLCPVDTGRLRNSITHTVLGEEQAVYIGTNVEYAAPVEIGHITASGSYVSPKPFLKPALENNRDKYKAIIKQYLKDD